MVKTLAEAFEDDGASFRVRRESYLRARFSSATPRRPLPLSVRLGLTALGLGTVGFVLLFAVFVGMIGYALIFH